MTRKRYIKLLMSENEFIDRNVAQLIAKNTLLQGLTYQQKWDDIQLTNIMYKQL